MKIMAFMIPQDMTPVVRLYDLLDCLPADAEVVSIRNDFYSLRVAMFVKSEFFAEVPPDVIPREAPLWCISTGDGGHRYEWRWMK